MVVTRTRTLNERRDLGLHWKTWTEERSDDALAQSLRAAENLGQCLTEYDPHDEED